MTGVEWILLLIGSIFLIGSFFVTEKLSSSELNKMAELSEEELKKIIARGLDNAKKQIDYSIDEQLELSMDKIERALGKETNDKIMAISEYSDTVLENMNKTHNEIMFLYSMLNDKHTELTGMVSEVQHLSADIRDAKKDLPKQKGKTTPAKNSASEPFEQRMDVKQKQTDGRRKNRQVDTVNLSKQAEINQKILALHQEGLSEVEIARKLGMGVGEIRLVIGLYRGE